MSDFDRKAPWIMAGLIRDLSIELLDAAAILGNIGRETGGLKWLAQLNGGAYGWVQWDGVRRDAYFAWCRENKLDRASDEANYRYLIYELTQTWEKKALPAMARDTTLAAKTITFDKEFERSGVKALEERVKWAERALRAYLDADAIQLPAFLGGGIASKVSSDSVEVATIDEELPTRENRVTHLIPVSWLQPCKMDRIITHWTAGRHKANTHERQFYHILFEGDGTPIKGDNDIADNVSTADDDYAAHTRAANTRSIGTSLCCMGGDGVSESPYRSGQWPMTRAQWDAQIIGVADLCLYYDIPVTSKTVLSHAEVEANLGIWQRAKWDYTRLSFDHSFVGAKACGDKLRGEVLAEIAKRRVEPEPVHSAPAPVPSPEPQPQTPAVQDSDATRTGAGVLATVGVATGVWQYSPWLAAALIAAAFAAFVVWRIIRSKKEDDDE